MEASSASVLKIALKRIIDKLGDGEPRLVVQMPENRQNADFWANVDLFTIFMVGMDAASWLPFSHGDVMPRCF